MGRELRIGVVGDYQPDLDTHIATDEALAHAAVAEGGSCETTWLPTVDLAVGDPALTAFDGLLVAPGSPYLEMEGALKAIHAARTEQLPLLGTCGGFQHVVIEYARNVLGMEAAHGEYDESAASPLIDVLACSLAGRTMLVTIHPGTRAADAYGSQDVTERYYCSLGIDPDKRDVLEDGGLVVSGTDQDGGARIIELPGDSFFVATLFVPQASSKPETPHPIVKAFVRAARQRSDRRQGHNSP